MFVHSLVLISKTDISIVSLIALFVYLREGEPLLCIAHKVEVLFLFDVVNIKGNISPGSYKMLIPFSIRPSSSLIQILQKQRALKLIYK